MVRKVAGCQLVSCKEEAAARIERMERAARAAKSMHPELKLLAFPELALSGYRLNSDLTGLAESWPDGPSLQRLSALAAELRLVIVAGFAESDASSPVLFDSAGVFDADGTPLGVYRKAHCLEKEHRVFAQGDELRMWRTEAGKFGVLICWDAAMPEAARVLALQDPDFLVVIAAWEDPYLSDFTMVVRARAFDNVLPILAVNSTGRDENSSFSGGSCIVDCLGKSVVEEGAAEDGLLVGDIDIAHTQRVRAGYGSQLRDRRPELYAVLSDESAAFLDESRLWMPK